MTAIERLGEPYDTQGAMYANGDPIELPDGYLNALDATVIFLTESHAVAAWYELADTDCDYCPANEPADAVLELHYSTPLRPHSDALCDRCLGLMLHVLAREGRASDVTVRIPTYLTREELP